MQEKQENPYISLGEKLVATYILTKYYRSDLIGPFLAKGRGPIIDL